MILALAVGHIFHTDFVPPGQYIAPSTRAQIEMQGELWSAGVQGNGSEAFAYAGPAYSFHFGPVEIRPSIAAGYFWEKTVRHPWHGSQPGRFMGQIELTLPIDGARFGVSVSKISTFTKGTFLKHGFDTAGAGLFAGMVIKYGF